MIIVIGKTFVINRGVIKSSCRYSAGAQCPVIDNRPRFGGDLAVFRSAGSTDRKEEKKVPKLIIIIIIIIFIRLHRINHCCGARRTHFCRWRLRCATPVRVLIVCDLRSLSSKKKKKNLIILKENPGNFRVWIGLRLERCSELYI